MNCWSEGILTYWMKLHHIPGNTSLLHAHPALQYLEVLQVPYLKRSGLLYQKYVFPYHSYCLIRHLPPVPDQGSGHILTSAFRWLCLPHKHWYCRPYVRLLTWTVPRYVHNCWNQTYRHSHHRHYKNLHSIHPDCHCCPEQNHCRLLLLLQWITVTQKSPHCKTAVSLSWSSTGWMSQYCPLWWPGRLPDNPVMPDTLYLPHTEPYQHLSAIPVIQQTAGPLSVPETSCQSAPESVHCHRRNCPWMPAMNHRRQHCNWWSSHSYQDSHW